MSASDKKPSARAQRLWIRMTEWYGTRLTELYGAVMPPDWCAVVDAADNETVMRVLSEMRQRHITYPPTFPEFDSLFAKAKAPTSAQLGPTIQERLCNFVLRNRRLTIEQLRLSWRYIGNEFDAPGADGKMRSHHGVEITGVIVPADGDHSGYRVMVADMQLENAA